MAGPDSLPITVFTGFLGSGMPSATMSPKLWIDLIAV